MKKSLSLVVFILAIFAAISGCSAMKDYPRYDQILTYDRPFDYTFLKTLEALNTFPEWVLEETDKNKGVIVIRNIQYGHALDRDKWVAKFLIKSLGRKRTSVELDAESQQLEIGGELLERIDYVIKASQTVTGEQQAQLVN